MALSNHCRQQDCVTARYKADIGLIVEQWITSWRLERQRTSPDQHWRSIKNFTKRTRSLSMTSGWPLLHVGISILFFVTSMRLWKNIFYHNDEQFAKRMGRSHPNEVITTALLDRLFYRWEIIKLRGKATEWITGKQCLKKQNKNHYF